MPKNAPAFEGKPDDLASKIGGELTHLFQQEISKIVSGITGDVKELIQKRFVSLTDETEARLAKAKGSIAGLSFGFDQIESYKPGQLAQGRGIYVGAWEPKDREGRTLGKLYNVFAAPEDLTNSSGEKVLLTFKGAAREIAAKKGWHGHNGLIVPNSAVDSDYEAYLYETLKGDAYKGEWFIPPRELLQGKDIDGNQVEVANFYALKNIGDFKGTYTTASGSGFAPWYWSSTEYRGDPDYVWDVRFTDGDGGVHHKDYLRLSCRPCRVELAL